MAELKKKRRCGVCGGERAVSDIIVLTLTEEERRISRETNGVDIAECVYCKPCHKVLSDAVTGPATLRGFMAVALKQLGLPDPQASARKYVDKLTAASAKRRGQS